MVNLRPPVVSGQFYPSSPNELRKQIGTLINSDAEKENCLACILPHAGYAYSGRVAALTVSSVNIKDRVILLGPNHTGIGSPFSIMTEGVWETPLGKVQVDTEFAEKILEASKFLTNDPRAHAHEHSIEVELPFLQYFKPEVRIVPIAFMSDDLFKLRAVGEEIAEVIKKLRLQNSVMIIASSDMTHYEPQIQASKKDAVAVDAILKLDESKLFTQVKKMDITMCGIAPVVAMISAAKSLGAKSAKLIKYQTSGDVTHDTTSVVGYAGITIS
jgi:AmmeMemoRadiSam system protein B